MIALVTEDPERVVDPIRDVVILIKVEISFYLVLLIETVIVYIFIVSKNNGEITKNLTINLVNVTEGNGDLCIGLRMDIVSKINDIVT